MRDFVIQVAAGIVTAAIGLALTRLVGGPPTPSLQTVGPGNSGHVSQRVQVNNVYQIASAGPPAASRRATQPADDDPGPWWVLIGGLAALLALAGTYIAVGDLIPGVFGGLALLLTVVTCVSLWTSWNVPGPKVAAAATNAIAILTAALVVWWSLSPPDNGAPRAQALMSELERQHPGLAAGPWSRATYVVQNLGALARALTIEEIAHLAFLTVAALLTLVMALVAFIRTTQWWAFANVAAGRVHRPATARWAVRFQHGGWPLTFAMLLLAVLCCVLSSGWAWVWIQQYQTHLQL